MNDEIVKQAAEQIKKDLHLYFFHTFDQEKLRDMFIIPVLQKLLIASMQDDREACWKDMIKFIENSRSDLMPNVSAYDALTTMLCTLNDVGIEGFGVSQSASKEGTK
jgi:hypothetical protein